MVEGSDFAQQTRAINSIDDVLITQETRTVCYNQPIYDDLRLEQHEYIGLTLGVGFSTTSLTLVDQTNNHASILILDNDSMFGTYTISIQNIILFHRRCGRPGADIFDSFRKCWHG